MSTLPRAIRPFANGQYRLLVLGLSGALFGSGLWLVASVFQVIELGGGPIEFSLVATAFAVGAIAMALVGGVAADRIPQKLLLLGVESLNGIVAATVAVLALTGVLQIWQLAVAGLLLGLASGVFYPAYSAILPSVLEADDLLAANGVEGVLRPAFMQVIGPVVASAAIAVWSPTAAFILFAAVEAVAIVGLLFLRATPVRRDVDTSVHPVRSVFSDLAGGFRYMFSTPWLLGTLSFACVFALLLLGPIEVLLPFAVKDQVQSGVQAALGGSAGAYALVLGSFGVGGAVGSIVIASRRMPRRYLTVMNLLWGAAGIPMVLIGFTNQLWLMAAAVFIVGFGFSAGSVIWGTLLQRRVPPALLGRVSSLDFFVSLSLLPVSMAIAGPVGVAIGLPLTFVIAGSVPIVFGIAAILIFRMRTDELAHPLNPAAEEREAAPVQV